MSTSTFRQRQRFLHGSLLLVTIVTLVISCANLVCFSHLKMLGKVEDDELPELIAPINWTCRRFLDIFGSSQPDTLQSKEQEHEHEHEHEHGHKHGHNHSGGPRNGLLLQGFALPLLVVACLTYFLSPESELFQKKKQGEPETSYSHLMMLTRKSLSRIGVGGEGDPNMTGWALFVVGIPALLVALLPQVVPLSHIQHKVPALASMPSIASRIYMLANPAGIAATMALALFLIPVAKHSSLLKVFGLSFTQALAFHRTAGWISLVFTLLHGILYCLIYGMFHGEENDSFLKAMGAALFPPWPSCWTLELFLLRGVEDDNNCNGYWRNFTGVISAVSFLVLGIASLPIVRRKMYRLFYIIHIPCAWIMMIAAIAHYSFVALFLLPNIIYYLGTTVPVWVSQLVVARKNKGFQLHSITPIEDSNGCYAVRFPHNYHQQTTGTKFGGVCKMCLPEISSIWHPFSVVLDPKDPGFLVFLIRGVGPFTKALLERMLLLQHNITSDDESATTTPTTDDEGQFDDADGSEHHHQSSSSPVVLLDGLYPAEHRWHSNSLSHESVLLVAGGVGIVPFISLLSELHHTMTSPDERSQQCNLRRVSLHWYCREEGLARFVCGKYLKHFVQDSRASGDQFLGSTNESIYDIDPFAEIFDDEEDVEVIEQSQEVLFEVFVHVTSKSISGGNLSDNVLLSSSDESSSICFDESPEKRVVSKPYLSLQSQEGEQIPRVLLICAFLGACLLAHYLYFWYVIDPFWTIVSRTYIVFMVSFITIIFGCGIAYLQSRRSSFRLIHERMEEDNDEETTVTESYNRYESVPMPLVRKRLTISSGRPLPSDVVAAVAKSENAGALFCGPSPLRKSIKKAIVEEKRRLKGRFHSPCAIYDEQSEM